MTLEWNEVLHTLFSASCHGLCPLLRVFFLWSAAKTCHRSEPPSVPHCEQAFGSYPQTLWCFDVPRWGPTILNLIDQPSGRAPGVCLVRENKERLWMCAIFPADIKWRSRPFCWQSMDHGWVSTGKLATVLSGTQNILCLTVLMVHSRFKSLSKRSQKENWCGPAGESAQKSVWYCSCVAAAAWAVAQTSTLNRLCWMKECPVGTQPVAKDSRWRGQYVRKSGFIQAIMNLVPNFFFLFRFLKIWFQITSVLSLSSFCCSKFTFFFFVCVFSNSY